MTPSDCDSTDSRIDRRTLLTDSIGLLGALAFGVGAEKADRPDTQTIDVTGTELFVPCLGETVRIVQGTWRVLADTQVSRGNCRHFLFHFHYDPLVIVEGQSTGRRWSGQGVKRESLTVCPPYPAQQTVTNSTTLTSDSGAAPRSVQYRFNGHVTINANGEWTVTRVRNEFLCHGGG